MKISIIPLLAILLMNAVVIGYVLKLREKTSSGFFLIISALSLIIWAGGSGLYGFIGEASPFALSVPYFAALLIPANYLYYSMTQPRPLRQSWDSKYTLILVFAPAIILAFFQTYSRDVATLFDYSYRADQISLRNTFTRGALLYSVACLTGAVSFLGVRYHSGSGGEQIIAKHLIVSILGPLFFAAFFWAASRQGGPSVLPSPSLLFALMAQLGIISVLRQEDLTRPRVLNRIVYHITAVLVAFLAVSLMSEFYVFAAGRFVMDRTVGWMVLGATLILLLAARFSRVESALDRLLFARAAEYRRIVEETQQELREARDRLRKSERLSVIGELAARVAHEIKNPLGPIKGYTQMMREKLEEAHDFRHREAFLRHLEVIAEEAENIDRRVRQFLDVAGSQQLLIEPLNVNRIVDRCGRLLELEIAATVAPLSGNRVQIEIQTESDLGDIPADAGRIEEAVFNVARNALDALEGHAHGHIRFFTRRAARGDGRAGVEIIIQDNGPGFNEAKKGLLFDPFYTEKPKGTGLGLSIVKSAIEAHGGHVELRNREGGGGEVALWLPREAQPTPGALLPKGLLEEKDRGEREAV